MKLRILCLIFSLLLHHATSFYSKMYRKCELAAKGYNIGSLQNQRIVRYDPGFGFKEGANGTQEIEYTEFDFLYL